MHKTFSIFSSNERERCSEVRWVKSDELQLISLRVEYVTATSLRGNGRNHSSHSGLPNFM